MLKRARRSGWWVTGIRDPESIAEHSWRAAITGMIIASMEGADPTRTAMLCVLHDTAETRIGDIPHVGRRYLTAAAAEDVVADQVAECPPEVAQTIQDAVAEFEAGETAEAQCAKDADKLECLVQAVEYQHGGADTMAGWIDSSLAALKTDSAKAIAEDVLKGDPMAWQQTRRT
ncbi:HD domain-containing protein [Glycomyces tarimensis]